MKISEHNLTGKTQTLTVTTVLPLEHPEVEGDLEETALLTDAHEALHKGVAESGPSTGFEESDGERVKRAADIVDVEKPKRAKCG